MWSYNYRQKVEATLNKDWSVLHWESYRKVQGCTNCTSFKQESAECPHKNGKHPANKDIKGLYLKQQKQRPDVCFNWNYKHHSMPLQA